MKTIVTGLLGLSFLALSAGCTVEERGARPRDRVEVIPARPSPQHVWVGGRWDERGGNRTWVEGRWELH
jgi:WXXGXW repeat (2 copies)